MDQETIKRFIEEAHSNAVEKGFYDCLECEGRGIVANWIGNDKMRIGTGSVCESCNGTGIDQNKNIGELLMLIVSELGEALEAHRCGRFADWIEYEDDLKASSAYLKESFEENIKDTFEDEIADVFIRLFDLCGYLGIEDVNIQKWKNMKYYSGNIGEALLYVSGMLCEMFIDKEKGSTDRDYICDTLSLLHLFCEKWNIPIQKHIEAKIAYNKTRPHKHGKEY